MGTLFYDDAFVHNQDRVCIANSAEAVCDHNARALQRILHLQRKRGTGPFLFGALSSRET
jgi:hypothetical protein